MSANYLKLAYPEFLVISERECVDCELDLTQQLYTTGGSQSAIIAQVYYDKLDLTNTPNQSFFLRIQSQSGTTF